MTCIAGGGIFVNVVLLLILTGSGHQHSHGGLPARLARVRVAGRCVKGKGCRGLVLLQWRICTISTEYVYYCPVAPLVMVMITVMDMGVASLPKRKKTKCRKTLGSA